MTAPAFAPRPPVAVRSVFIALLRRDAHVVMKELPFFLLRVTLQPLLFVLVFGFLLPRMGFVQRGYTSALLPGILGISMALASLQSVALPMVSDFGWTREIEDRLLAPVPINLIAFEKVVAGIAQGVIAALFVLPVARLIMGPIAGLDVASVGELLVITIMAAAAFSTFGLWLGTIIEPVQVGLMFGFIVAPMIFFGCAYYPWQGLSAVPVMKYLVLVNPLVYVSEGMRGAITPSLPHMPLPMVAAGLIIITGLFWRMGIRTFNRRAVG